MYQGRDSPLRPCSLRLRSGQAEQAGQASLRSPESHSVDDFWLPVCALTWEVMSKGSDEACHTLYQRSLFSSSLNSTCP